MKNSISVTDENQTQFFSVLQSPVKFKLYLLKNLPAAYFSGLKLREVNAEKAIVTIPYKWFTKNPFRSTYFACLSMAAEMSTGILAMANTYKRSPKVSMLIVGIEGKFYKKATGITLFECNKGYEIKSAVERAVQLKEPQRVSITSTGRNSAGGVVAEFIFTWSFKVKE